MAMLAWTFKLEFCFSEFLEFYARVGKRVVLIDMIGFGKSDKKPKERNFISSQQHRLILRILLTDWV